MTALLDLHPVPGHPAVVVAGVHAALDGYDAAAPVGPGEYAGLVAQLARARARLQALELKVVAAAEKARVPELSGARNTASWLAGQTRGDGAAAARDTRLATDLDDKLPVAAAAFGEGAVSVEHARVIAEAMRRLPSGLSPADRAAVETRLTEDAMKMDPKTLRRRARRALEVVEPDREKVDAHENTQLEDEESRARTKTRLTLHDHGDGTTTGHFTVPTLAASVLRKVLDTMTSPRRGRTGATNAQAGDQRIDRDWAHERGLAFTSVLEHLPTDHLHAKTAATIVVTLDQDHLTGQLTAAGLDTGDLVSASGARRLACGASILPAILNGQSMPVDAGRQKRFFTDTQRGAGRHEMDQLRRRGLRRPLRLDRAPPPTTLVVRGPNRPREHGTPVRVPPPPHPRPRLRPPTAPRRLGQVQPTDVGRRAREPSPSAERRTATPPAA